MRKRHPFSSFQNERANLQLNLPTTSHLLVWIHGLEFPISPVKWSMAGRVSDRGSGFGIPWRRSQGNRQQNPDEAITVMSDWKLP